MGFLYKTPSKETVWLLEYEAKLMLDMKNFTQPLENLLKAAAYGVRIQQGSTTMDRKKLVKRTAFAAMLFSEASAIVIFAAGAVFFSKVMIADARVAQRQEQKAFVQACVKQGAANASCRILYRLALK